ncbi:MAG: hypothetical protein M1821_000036 [Bathelium mastoideum]|nr:MAG: hypothetical protein M1821_000036 [Bathelium mastoideum]KAI9687934.1 MAG: hypothetical protein M1822_002016 [Bathelium mastoideum]
MAGPWDKVGQVLPAGSEIHEPGEHWRLPWAPAVVEKDSVFYVFYAVTIARTRKSAIGVATCTNLDAPHTWVDHGAIIYTGEGPNADAYPFNVSNAIDPSVLIDPQSSIPILQYGSFFQGIFQVPLADDLLSLRNRNPPFSATHIADDNAAAIKAKSYSVGAHPIEGSALSYHEPYYYVYYAHGVCCQLAKIADTIPLADVYEIRIGRSKNLTGPYVDKNGVGLLNGGGSVFLASQGNVFAPGGPSVTKNSSGTDIFYYHYLDRNGDLEDKHALLGWKPLTYGMDGWPQING